MSLSREWQDRLVLFSKELERQLFHPLGTLAFSGFDTTRRLSYEEAAAQPRRPYAPGEEYGEKFGYTWFFTTLRLPEQAAGKRIVLDIQVGGEGLLFVNGQPFGTNRADRMQHAYHHIVDLVLTEHAVPGQTFDIAFEAYNGDGLRKVLTGPVVDEKEFLTREWYSYRRPVMGTSRYGAWDEEAYQLFLDMEVLQSLRDSLEPESLRVMQIDNALKAALNALEFEDGPEEFARTVRQARWLLTPVLACRNGSTAPKMYAVGHSHLDLAWLWTTEETVRKCGRSFSTQLHLMEMYPGYKFLQSQPWLYEQTKKNYPGLYQRIQEKVKAGQFIPEGGMWVEADTNLSGGESLVRQFLYGKRFFKEEFGVDSEFLWLPDAFGYSAALPQIMKGCGIRYFSTQKLGWAYNDNDPFPYNYFTWQGLDGSRITSFMDTNYGAYTDPKTVRERYKNRNSMDNCDRMMYPYGYGDGGAGPTRDHIENLLRLKDLEGVPRCEMTTPNQFFRDLEDGPLQPDLYVGELYFAAHRGVYTSQAKVKQGNRRSEFALREADVWTALLGARNDADQERWYKLLLFNQFHDVLPGSGIAEIYQQARSDYDCILRESGEWLSRLLSGSQPDAVTAFNSMGWTRTALLRLPQGWRSACGENGPLPVQAEGDEVYARVSMQPFSSTVLYRSDAPAQQAPAIVSAALPVLENELLVVRFAADGSLESVFDKVLGREWLKAPGNRLRMYRDIPRHFDAWDIDSITFENPVELNEPARFLSESHGPLFSRVRTRREIGRSVVEQTITLEAGSRRITFETRVDWKETHKLLKAEFPFALHAEEMVNEIQFGFIRRPTHASRRYDQDRFEVCNQKWSAIAQSDRGAAVLNDGKYGIRGTGSTLSLSLLRAPKAPDFHADTGVHQFTYAVTFWNGALEDSHVERRGYELNQPVLVLPGARPLPSLLAVSGHGVVIDTVKPAEDGDGIVVRAYQSMDRSARAQFTLAMPADSVTECDLLERSLSQTDFRNGSWHAEFTPFRLRSFHIRGVRPIVMDE